MTAQLQHNDRTMALYTLLMTCFVYHGSVKRNKKTFLKKVLKERQRISNGDSYYIYIKNIQSSLYIAVVVTHLQIIFIIHSRQFILPDYVIDRDHCA